MGLGVNEILLVIAASIVSIVVARRRDRRWIALVPLVFLNVALLTPADPMSTLLIALPNVLLMALAVRVSRRTPQRQPSVSA